MVIETAISLAEAVCELGLLDAVQADMLVNDLAARYPHPRDLARHLLQTEWLTAFQVNQILQGRGRHLRLGPYVLLERIGAGGMGEVFKARHRNLHRVAALKILSGQRLDSALARQRFLREAEAAAHLSHPNIVAVHDAAEEGEVSYLAMEYIDGIDLARLVLRSGPLPAARAALRGALREGQRSRARPGPGGGFGAAEHRPGAGRR